MALITLSRLLEAAVISTIVYYVGVLIYRLFLHPLARFPGPKLAAATDYYELYFDVAKGGMFLWEIERMHDKYGPIVRINPDELHIRDADFFDEIYGTGNKKRDKYDKWAKMAGAPTSTSTTVKHDVHRQRRAPLNPFFAKRSVVSLEPKIQEKVDGLCARLEAFAKTGEPFRLDVAYGALTTDVIMEYCYGYSYGYLQDPNFKLEWKESMDMVFSGSQFRRATPWLTQLMQNFPDEYILKMAPGLGALINFQAELKKEAEKAFNTPKEKRSAEPSILKTLLESDLVPPEERTIAHLVDEGSTIVAAGVETTAKSLATTTFYLLATPGVLPRLQAELKTVMPRPDSRATWTELEQLPYLSAVVYEGIRLSYGVTTRSPRQMDEPLRYKDWVIPPRAAVSQISYFVTMDPTIFPDPTHFNPDRWLQEKRLDHYLANFGKGSRICLGLNLAYAEMFLTLASVFRRFDLELHETTIDDVKITRDAFVAAPKDGSKGVRGTVRGLRKN
ncbi:cytochrome protein [Eremomyces bilateralis CBS 781.70]|uniref:Cytochrome protein n=1 Tax=Eremomyces bilateralis CBS 781.70 TaxID=1392243 RepID=A0A6G1FXY6_9PEZI|nr:cytochrome protein [Eremomyces bilateralis CBS 781.70]KAF1810551.1 cytochrome protein [Eremomyces bilateralis CBS 781.70]